MLILLPPSEGKTAATRGKSLDLGALDFPELQAPRAEILDALVELCRQRPHDAAGILGLGPSQRDLVQRNAALASAPTARAERIYTGVLYEALDLMSLDTAARRRAARQVVIMSGLFGMLRPQDRVPAYRLSGTVALPGVGRVASHWSRHLSPAVEDAAGDGLVLDLRSGAYTPFWRPDRARADRVVTMRVLHEQAGKRTVVSHFNKATKGRIVRDLVTAGTSPRRISDLVGLLGDLGHRAELHPPHSGRPGQLDIVVAEL